MRLTKSWPIGAFLALNQFLTARSLAFVKETTVFTAAWLPPGQSASKIDPGPAPNVDPPWSQVGESKPRASARPCSAAAPRRVSSCQHRCRRAHSALVPGALDTLADVRRCGLKIGSTTGCNRTIMDVLVPLAGRQGYEPDRVVCSDDTVRGRPTPLMMYKVFLDLAVWPGAVCVKVDDTVPGIAEGLSAGCWAVGVAMSGNAFGASPEDLAGVSSAAIDERRATASRILSEA